MTPGPDIPTEKSPLGEEFPDLSPVRPKIGLTTMMGDFGPGDDGMSASSVSRHGSLSGLDASDKETEKDKEKDTGKDK